MKKLTAFVLSAMMVLSLAACGAKTETPADTSTPAADATKPAEVAKLTYAVEAGSAGEEVALANGYNVVSVDSQAKALMEVQAGTADAAIIDSLMAGAMVGEGASYPDLTITDQKLTEELYGVGCRKGSDLASFINSVMADAYADGVLEATAETYGVQAALIEQPASEFTASESDSDVQYIKDKGTLVIGITEFEPMDYQDAQLDRLRRRHGQAGSGKAGRGACVYRDQLGQQGLRAERQGHRCGLERHDHHHRRPGIHGVHQRLLQQRSGRCDQVIPQIIQQRQRAVALCL